MTKSKTFNTIEEIQEHYLPNQILNDLERNLSENLNLTLNSKISCLKNKEDPTRGRIELNIQKNNFLKKYPRQKKVESIIKDFYSKRGYKISQDGKNEPIMAKKPGINRRISIFQEDSQYIIQISKNPFAGKIYSF